MAAQLKKQEELEHNAAQLGVPVEEYETLVATRQIPEEKKRPILNKLRSIQLNLKKKAEVSKLNKEKKLQEKQFKE